MLYEASNSSNTTGSTYTLVFMQRSISLYRALKNTRFSSTSPTRIFGDFWYVIEDMFLDQKPLKNLLLQLVAGWATFRDKMPGLKTVCRSQRESCSRSLIWLTNDVVENKRPLSWKGTRTYPHWAWVQKFLIGWCIMRVSSQISKSSDASTAEFIYIS